MNHFWELKGLMGALKTVMTIYDDNGILDIKTLP